MGRGPLRSRRSEDIVRVVMAVFVVAGALIMLVVVRSGSTSIVEVPVEQLGVGADDLTVFAVVYVSTCGEPDRLVFEETATAVRVTVRVRRRSGDCESIGRAHRMTGTLTAPLAGRTLSSG